MLPTQLHPFITLYIRPSVTTLLPCNPAPSPPHPGHCTLIITQLTQGSIPEGTHLTLATLSYVGPLLCIPTFVWSPQVWACLPDLKLYKQMMYYGATCRYVVVAADLVVLAMGQLVAIVFDCMPLIMNVLARM